MLLCSGIMLNFLKICAVRAIWYVGLHEFLFALAVFLLDFDEIWNKRSTNNAVENK